MLLVFTLGMLAAGASASVYLWGRADAARWDEGHVLAPALDRVAGAVILALAGAIACAWALALAHALTAPALLACGVVALGGGGAGVYAQRASFTFAASVPRSTVIAVVAALFPLVLFTAFVAWRGAVLPPYNNDALAYHLPKAVLMMKARGFELFQVSEPRISTWPSDYELLLASSMLLSGTDAFTAAIGTVSFVLFLLLAARTAAGFWGDGLHVAGVVLLTAAAPIVVLHAGLHKNDLLFGASCLGASAWAARWVVRRCVPSLAFAVIALLLCIGTKVSGSFVFVVLGPALVWGSWRARRALSRRFLVASAALSACGAILVGGAWVYVTNLRALGRLTVPPEIPVTGYGDLHNVWQFTYLALAKPFSLQFTVWVPWKGRHWWWPSNDMWCSHFGVAVTVAAVLLVPCVLRYRSRGLGREQTLQSLFVAAVYVLTLPIRVVPSGTFNTFVRYVVCVVPILLAWTVSPIVLECMRRWGRLRPIAGGVVLAGAAGVFVSSAWTYGVDADIAPLAFLSEQLSYPQNRIPWIHRKRSASTFDRIAPPDAVCAVDVGFDTWIYPAWGEGWTREVQSLPRTDGPVPIEDRVQWVLVDRTWNVFFGHPAFTDMSKARLLGQGSPSEADTKVLRQLLDDPRFELVYHVPEENQAIFRRR